MSILIVFRLRFVRFEIIREIAIRVPSVGKSLSLEILESLIHSFAACSITELGIANKLSRYIDSTPSFPSRINEMAV